jgi:nucleoside-diphosphate-sugar epimerase
MQTTQQTSILLAGAGDIASLLGEQLLAQGWQISALRRNTALLSPVLRSPSVTAIAADLLQADSLQALHQQRFDAVVITLTPDENSEAGYRRSYVDATRNLLAALRTPPRYVLFVSSTSVYGQQDGEWVDESSAADASVFNGRIMREAEQLILNSGIAASCVRFGGIYGAGRTRLLREVQNGSHSVRDNQWSNRIHEQDAASVLQHLLLRAQRGDKLAESYVAVDDAPAPLCVVKNWLAEQLGVTHRWPELDDTAYGGRRCNNALLKASGFTFRYADYHSGYQQLIAEYRNTL